MPDKPAFDPNKPYEAATGDKPAFDPSSPFQPAERTVFDKLTGRDGGERYQTWPERAGRAIAGSVASAATFPGDVMAGKDSPENTSRVMDTAMLATPLSPAAKAGSLPFKAATETPSARELVDTAGKQFEAFRNSGVEYSANSVADWARRVQQDLLNSGIHPVDAPATYQKLQALENAPPGAFVTPANLHSLRQSLGATAQNFNPQAARDQLAASRGIKALDSYISGPPAGGVVAGSPTAASTPFEAARGNYAAGQRANGITGELDRATTGILERSEGRAQAANSGRNIDNTIRSKAEALLEKPKEVSGLSDAEIGALDHVVEGGWYRNLNRNIGNKFGGGGGVGQTGLGLMTAGTGAGIGAYMGGSPLVTGLAAAGGAIIPPALGSSARSMANLLAKKDLRAVDELMRTRSPLYEERAANPQNVMMSPEQQALIAKAMLLEQMGRQRQ